MGVQLVPWPIYLMQRIQQQPGDNPMDYTAPMTDEILRDLRRRTHARQATARIELGPRWVLHPDNAVRPAGHAHIIDSPSLYCQWVGRVTRDPSMMDGFRLQQVGRELRV